MNVYQLDNKIYTTTIMASIKVLELFSGTGSIRKICDTLGWETISLDIVEDVDHKIDILDFDYKQYPVGCFDIVWASPPCTEYSIAKTRGVRDIDGANKIVLKTLEMIVIIVCMVSHIEREPEYGLIKH